jgi:hypothetical protein
MRSTVIFAAVLMLGACAKTSKPASPVTRDGGETNIVQNCGAMQHKVKSLYEEAADSEAIVPNRRSEFIAANLHMVMSDCRLSPAQGYACLQQVKTAKELENACLVYLDDEGTVEGYRFGKN